MHDLRHDPAAPDERTHYDLHAPDALHPLTDIEALRQQLDSEREAREYLAARVDALEARQAMLVSAIDRHADALQVLVLRATPRGDAR